MGLDAVVEALLVERYAGEWWLRGEPAGREVVVEVDEMACARRRAVLEECAPRTRWDTA